MAANDSPLVSVLITMFNRGRYVGEAIESVLNSTFQDFEIVIVDDQSTDNSLEVARSYASRDPRIRVYRNEKNLGDYPNRNQAAKYARGKYLKYIDADDKIYKHGLQIMVESMEKFPEAGWGVCTLRQDEDRMFPFVLHPREAYFRNYLETDRRIRSKKIFSKAPLSAIVKREVFFKVNGFNAVRHFGDGDMWNRLGRYEPVVLMSDGIIWWRGHEDQENKKRKNNHVIQIRSWNNIIEHLTHPDCPLKREEVKALVKRLRLRQYKMIVDKVVKERRVSAAFEMLGELKKPSVTQPNNI